MLLHQKVVGSNLPLMYPDNLIEIIRFLTSRINPYYPCYCGSSETSLLMCNTLLHLKGVTIRLH